MQSRAKKRTKSREKEGEVRKEEGEKGRHTKEGGKRRVREKRTGETALGPE